MLSALDYSELCHFRTTPAHIDTGASARLQNLINQRFLAPASYIVIQGIGVAPDLWTLTQAGEDALSEFENARRKETEDKRQQRFQNQISIAQVLVPLVTFVLGLVVEHFSGIIGAIAQFFR